MSNTYMYDIRTKLLELIAKINNNDTTEWNGSGWGLEQIDCYINSGLLKCLFTGDINSDLIVYVNEKFKDICNQTQHTYFKIEFFSDVNVSDLKKIHVKELNDIYVKNSDYIDVLNDNSGFVINKCSHIKNFEIFSEVSDIEKNMLYSYSKHSSTLNVCLLKNELDRKINDESITTNEIMKYQEKFDHNKLTLYRGKTVGEIKNILSYLIKKNIYEIGTIPVLLYHYKYVYNNDKYEFNIGDTITHNFFTSTTYYDDLSVIKWLYNKLGKYVRLCILLEEGKKYNFISMSTYMSYHDENLWYGNENEIILDFGTSFKIIDIQEYKFKLHNSQIYVPITNIYVKIENSEQMIGGNQIKFNDINSILGFIGSSDSVVHNLKYEKYKKKYTETKLNNANCVNNRVY